jgi:exonuclease SbcD
MGFGEAGQQKQVMVVALTGRETTVTALQVPCFQPLVRITGSVDQIISRIEELGAEQSTAWIEVEYTGSAVLPNLRELVEEAAEHTTLEIRRIKNRQISERALAAMNEDENLDDLDTLDVFLRCIDQNAVPQENRPGLIQAYQEILAELSGADRQAED